MSNTKDKDSQQPLTPREQLRNLVEGLCEEPFQLDLARFDDQFQNLRVKLLSYAQDHLNLDSSTEFVTEVDTESSEEDKKRRSAEEDKKRPDDPPPSRKM